MKKWIVKTIGKHGAKSLAFNTRRRATDYARAMEAKGLVAAVKAAGN